MQVGVFPATRTQQHPILLPFPSFPFPATRTQQHPLLLPSHTDPTTGPATGISNDYLELGLEKMTLTIGPVYCKRITATRPLHLVS